MYIPNIFSTPNGKALGEFLYCIELFLKLKKGQIDVDVDSIPSAYLKAWEYHKMMSCTEENYLTRMERIPTEFDPLATAKRSPRSSSEGNRLSSDEDDIADLEAGLVRGGHEINNAMVRANASRRRSPVTVFRSRY